MYFNNSRILDMCKYSYLSNKSELDVNEIYNLYSNYVIILYIQQNLIF